MMAAALFIQPALWMKLLRVREQLRVVVDQSRCHSYGCFCWDHMLELDALLFILARR
jgi:hypothetical protein